MKTYKKQISRFSLKKNKTDIQAANIRSSKDAAEYARQFYFEDIEIYESVFLLLLNASNNTIGYVKISQGGISGALVDTRILAKYAVDSLATAVILIHNHPGGTTEPSQADKAITKKVKEGLKLLDVMLLDHIILSPEEDQYFSFGDEGLI